MIKHMTTDIRVVILGGIIIDNRISSMRDIIGEKKAINNNIEVRLMKKIMHSRSIETQLISSKKAKTSLTALIKRNKRVDLGKIIHYIGQKMIIALQI